MGDALSFAFNLVHYNSVEAQQQMKVNTCLYSYLLQLSFCAVVTAAATAAVH